MTARRRFGSLRKTKAGRWQARYKGPDGRPRTAPHTFPTKTDASIYLAGVETDMHRRTHNDPKAGKVRLATYSQEWLAYRDLAPRSRDLCSDLLRIHLFAAARPDASVVDHDGRGQEVAQRGAQAHRSAPGLCVLQRASQGPQHGGQ